MIGMLLAAAVSSGFTADAALNALKRDDDIVSSCAQNSRGLLAEIALAPLSANPKIVLVTMHNECTCGAQNCPFWVYRVKNSQAQMLLSGYAVAVKTVASNGAVPDVVGTSHASAALSIETHYRYTNGTFVETQSWKVRGDERKPATIGVRFAPGTTQAHLSGTIGYQWGDDYTFEGSQGQSLEIAGMRAQRATIVRLHGNKIDRVLSAGESIRLPASGKYSLGVELVDSSSDAGDATYAFTLSIR